MSEKQKESRAGLEEKEKLSRVSRHRKGKSRKLRRVLLILVLLAIAVFVAGAVFDFPYINIARKGGSWLAKKVTGDSGDEASGPDYLFLTQPQSRVELSGDVSSLFILYAEGAGDVSQRNIIYLSLFTYYVQEGEGEIYLLPETTVAYNAQGQPIQLRQALGEEGGLDLMRSTVHNMTGSEVDYLVTLGFGEAMLMIQDLPLPPVLLQEDLELPNPVSGDVSHLQAGQEICDGDRLLSYLVASDKQDTRDARLERARSYLPGAFAVLSGEGQAALQEDLTSLQRSGFVDPGAGDAEGDRAYLASMIQAFCDLTPAKLTVRAVPEVEVVNGCGLPDLGKRVGEKLVSLGVEVSGSAGNAKVTVDGEEVNDFSHDVSSVVYRSRDSRVEAYARYLGVLMSVGDVSYDPGTGSEITLIAGRDLAM